MEQSGTWLCKICFASKLSRKSLWLHVKSKHAVHAPKKLLPCLFNNCVFSFASLSSLTSHLSRCHPCDDKQQMKAHKLQCLHCNAICFTIHSFMTHLRVHVRRSETVVCPVAGCPFKSNVLGTFWSHYSRKHSFLTYKSIRDEIRCKSVADTATADASTVNIDDDVQNETCVSDPDLDMDAGPAERDCTEQSTMNDLEHELALFFLKLETVYGISRSAIQAIISDLNRMNQMSVSFLRGKLVSLLNSHSCSDSLSTEVFDLLKDGLPFAKVSGAQSLLSTYWRRNKFIHSNYAMVVPVEYCLGCIGERRCTFVYVPFLDVLRNILKIPHVLKYVLAKPNGTRDTYVSYHSGTLFQKNSLFSREEFSLQIGLYYDDFEIANPLGTSRGKFKLSGFYWTIANLPPELRGSIDNIQLAVLCRYSYMQHFGICAVLTKFLEDVATLEKSGIFVDSLGAEIRGSISFVVADNLAAHLLFGMTQSFGPYVDRFCRFCMATNEHALGKQYINSSEFSLRTPTNYAHHVSQVEEGVADASRYGIRNDSVFHSCLKFFHATEGFPPDISHDLLEGVVPYELALCISIFIAKGYFASIKEMNEIMSKWNFMYTDRVNKPQPLPNNTVQRKSVGGNATENRTLLRLFPLIFGESVPVDEPSWHLILELKALVELSFAGSFHEADIVYFETKIQSHHMLFNEIFPEERLKPKHHFLSHYAQLTKCYGPLLQFSTLRFEAKHSFFKRVVNESKNFKNVCKMLSERHQRLQCYLMASGSLFNKTYFVVKNGVVVPLSFSPPFLPHLQSSFPGTDTILWIKNCRYNGIEYHSDLCIIDGFSGGLPTFCRIFAIAAHGAKALLLCVSQESFYNEHMHSYEVHDTGVYHVHSFAELKDYYPLPRYVIKSDNYVTLKHYVSWRL